MKNTTLIIPMQMNITNQDMKLEVLWVVTGSVVSTPGDIAGVVKLSDSKTFSPKQYDITSWNEYVIPGERSDTGMLPTPGIVKSRIADFFSSEPASPYKKYISQ
jgi:hypothetical protein